MLTDDIRRSSIKKGSSQGKLISWVEFANLEASSRITLDDGTILTRCDQCRAMWKERNERGIEGEPPCDGCQVDLLEENVDAAKVFLSVRNQVIFYFNGEHNREYDINHTAIWAYIDHYPKKLEKPFELFERVLDTYHHFLRERNERDG